MKDSAPKVDARILLYDLETSPLIGYTWTTWQTDVIKIIQERQIISFAYKWLDEEPTYCKALCDYPGYKKDKTNNKALIKDLYRLFEEADIVVGHNVKKFDDRRSNTDFIKHRLPPPPPHKQVDTLEFARSKFDFSSNRLNDLGQFLGLGQKVKHPGFEMWEGCLAGEKWAWDLMKKYNKQDVILLERVYLRLRPYMMRHPNLGHWGPDVGCPACNCTAAVARGYSVSASGKRPRFKCKGCGKWYSGAKIKGVWRFS